MAGFKELFVRRVPNGSIALVAQTTTGYFYVAVAGAGGESGGSAGDALTCGLQGGNAPASLHDVNGEGGGGGGGRSYAGSTNLPEGPGLPDGTAATLDEQFLKSLTSTGGSTNNYAGGDGYYGGGSGDLGGGGGGSYVGPYCSHVTTGILPLSYNTLGNGQVIFKNSIMTVQRLARVPHARPSFNIYIWLTTYNMLRIVGGRGTLMFQ